VWHHVFGKIEKDCGVSFGGRALFAGRYDMLATIREFAREHVIPEIASRGRLSPNQMLVDKPRQLS